MMKSSSITCACNHLSIELIQLKAELKESESKERLLLQKLLVHPAAAERFARSAGRRSDRRYPQQQQRQRAAAVSAQATPAAASETVTQSAAPGAAAAARLGTPTTAAVSAMADAGAATAELVAKLKRENSELQQQVKRMRTDLDAARALVSRVSIDNQKLLFKLHAKEGDADNSDWQ